MLVGRREDLATVCAALRAPGRVLVVIGEAGVGKSRLVTEATAAVDVDVNVLTGRCLPLSVDLPLLPIIDMLRALFSVRGGALFEHAVSLCPPFVRGELARLLPELGGDPTAGEAQRDRQFEAVRRVLLETPSPAVVIDDLHWCDAASLDLLEYLIARPDGPAVVLISRPLTRTSDRIRQWLGRVLRLPAARRLALGPLSAAEVTELLAALGWSGTPAEAELIAGRAGGIPYYLEQLVSMAADGALPEGLQSLLDGQLAGLGADAVDVLRVLSVAGRPVTDDELHAMCGDRAGDAIRELGTRGLIGRPALHGARLLRAPAHALLAEAVRADLTAAELRRIHRRIAVAFAAQPHIDADDVARHLGDAGDATAEAEWRLRAAEQARRRAAPREAYGHLARVIALDPAADVHVYLDAHVLARHAGDTGAAAELAERAMARFGGCVTDDVRMRLWHAVGHHRVLRSASGLDALSRAVEIGRSMPGTPQFGYVLYDLIRHLRGYGRDTEALRLGPELSALASESDDADLVTLAEVELAWHALLVGDDAAAMSAFAHARLRSARSVGPGLNAAAVITAALLMSGQLEETASFGQQVIAEREAAGLRGASVTGSLRADVAEARLEQGRADEAEQILGPVVPGVPAPDAAATAQLRSRLDVARGRIADALRFWQNSPEPLPYPLWLAEATPALLTALVEGGRVADAADRGLASLDVVLSCDQSRFAGMTIHLVRRALADLAETCTTQALARKRSAQLDAAIARAPVDPFAADGFPVTRAATGLTDAAERSRVEGRSDPQLWQRAAGEWRALDRPWRSAYCSWREAQAGLAARGSRSEARASLGRAWTEAAGHVPLRACIAALARAARLDLPDEGRPEPRAEPAPGLLTERETAVLRLLSEGLTNVEIGRALYLSPKTVSVHVTHILRKLGARTRVDATARAHRAGLLG